MKNITLLFLTLMTLAFYGNAQCNYTIELNDSYGDGWNGISNMDVLVNGIVVLDDIGVSSGATETFSFSVNPGDDITTVFNPLATNFNPDWAVECSYKIFDATSTEVFDAPAGGAPNGGPADITTGTLAGACPPCPDPSGLTSTPTSLTETTLDWAVGGSETNWTYEYGATGFTPGSGTTGTAMTTPTASLSGLTAGTTYDVYVQANCGGGDGDSNWVGPTTWTQPNVGDTCMIPITATVETDCSTATPITIDYATAADLGTVTMSCDAFGVNTGAWLEFTAPTSGAITLNMSDSNEFAIYDTCGGTELICVNTATATIDLAGLTGGITYKLAVWKDDATVGTTDVCIEEITCIFPTDLNAVVTSATDADLSWTDNNSPAATMWEYVVQAPGTGVPAGAGTATSSNPTSVSGLTDGDDYEFYVRADCGGGTFSAWSGPFTWTQIVPPANDNCMGAIALDASGFAFADNPVDGTVEGATSSGFTAGCGLGVAEVWYTAVVPASGNLTIETGPDTATSNGGFDSVIQVYTSDSDCTGTLTSIGCDDDGADTGSFSLLELTTLTPGTTVYIRVWEYNDDATEPFAISAYGAIPNDDCPDAIALTLGVQISSDNTGATDSGVTTSCDSGVISDLWYSFEAPSSGEVDITCSAANYALFSDCTTVVDCNMDNYSGLTAGNIYYVRVTDDGTTRVPGGFTLLVEEATLTIDEPEAFDSFSYYPNPAKNTLNLSAPSAIQQVTFINVLGQRVLEVSPNALDTQIHLDGLQSGAYFMTVSVNDTSKTFRILKQ